MTKLFRLGATLCLVASSLPSVWAFGAGEVDEGSFIFGKSWRHGVFEASLEGMPRLNITNAPKFTRLDTQRVYLGNWLRDYSALLYDETLTVLHQDILTLVVSVLAFRNFGQSTNEFRVTNDRLRVYLPVEHLDNPLGYADGSKAPNKVHPGLRPKLDPRELLFDPKSGMKNYLGNDGQGYDTSTAYIRRSLTKAIELGRKANGKDNNDLYEAYRYMGDAFHTLEDFMAHTNFVELTLRKMGVNNVFCYVGDKVEVDTPAGKAPPLVTGNSSIADNLTGLLGYITEALSDWINSNEATVDNEKSINNRNALTNFKRSLHTTLLRRQSSASNSASNTDVPEEIVKGAEELKEFSDNFDPNQFEVDEAHAMFMKALDWRNQVLEHDVEVDGELGVEKRDNEDELFGASGDFVLGIMKPILKGVVQKLVDFLREATEVITDRANHKIFIDSNWSDPSHSLIAKDRLENILNDPAGQVAKVIVQYATGRIVQAWTNKDMDAQAVITDIVEALHHPYYASADSEIQTAMANVLDSWVSSMSKADLDATIERLERESVRYGHNLRLELKPETIFFDVPHKH